MAAKTKFNPQACFFVSRDKLLFFSLEREEIIELPFSAEIAQDLEIISPSSLERVLKSWIEQNKINPAQVVLFLDNSTCFHNLYPKSINASDSPEAQAFLDSIPFSETHNKWFSLQDNSCLTVINKHFLVPLIATLEKEGFLVVGVSPAFIFGIDFSKKSFDVEAANQLLANTGVVPDYSFLPPEEIEAKLTEPQPFLSFRISKKLIVLAIVFIILIGILVGLLLMQRTT